MRSHPPCPHDSQIGSDYIILQHYICSLSEQRHIPRKTLKTPAMILHLLLDLLDLKGWLIFLCVLLIVVDMIRNKNPPHYPPGPWPLPVVGNIFTAQDFKSHEKVRDKIVSFDIPMFARFTLKTIITFVKVVCFIRVCDIPLVVRNLKPRHIL